MSEFQEWMRANAGALSAKPLSEVYLPGTHDSGAFKVDTDVILSDSQREPSKGGWPHLRGGRVRPDQ